MATVLNTVVSHEKVTKDDVIDDPEQCLDIPDVKSLVKSVASAVQVALTQLDRLWTDVGVASGERDVVCREILNAVESSLRGKINDARETKAQVTLKIRLALRRIKAIYTQLGGSPPNTIAFLLALHHLYRAASWAASRDNEIEIFDKKIEGNLGPILS